MLRRLQNTLLGAIVAIALAFGGAQALANSGSGSECVYDPPSRLGSCSSQHECEQACSAQGGTQGFCNDGCCTCFM